MYREVVQEKQELLHTIDSLYAGLLMVGNNGRLLQINPSARTILSIAPFLPLIDVPYDKAITDARVRAILARALSSGHAEVADEVAFPIADAAPEDQFQERIYQVQCATVRDDDGEPAGIVAIFNDITEIRGVEQMKTAFISTVSHELRTPLTSIKGFISTLLTDEEGYYDEATRREFYGIIDSECDRLKPADRGPARHFPHRAGQCDADELAAGGRRRRDGEGPRRPARLRQGPFPRHGLPRRLPRRRGRPGQDGPDPDEPRQQRHQIFAPGRDRPGRRAASSGTPPTAPRRPRSRCASRTRAWASRASTCTRVFEKFYRVDNRDNREIGGTGIGLALVKALVEDGHKGKVTVDSEPGHGTTFTVVLPLRRAPQ